MPVLSSMLVISEFRSRRVVSISGCIGVRTVSNSRGSTNVIFITCAIYANSRPSSGRKIVVAKGANNDGRNLPFCCISRRLLDKDNLVFAIKRSFSLYFLRRTLIRSVSAFFSMAFLSFIFCSSYEDKNLSLHATRHPLTDCHLHASPFLYMTSG